MPEKEKFSPIDHLRKLRNDYSDEIPTDIIRGGVPHEQIKYKVRKNWWTSLVFGLERAHTKGLLPPELETEVLAFIRYYGSKKFHKQPLTTALDIAAANELLNKILGNE